MGDSSFPVDQLREHQRRLREAVDAFEAAPVGSADSTRLFSEVNALVREVVTARRDIPLRRHQAKRDRYDLPVRVLGCVVGLAGLAALVGAAVHWINGWLGLLALALLVVAVRAVLFGGGERGRRRAGDTPGWRLAAVTAGLVSAVSIFVSAFVTWWALAFAIVGAVLAVSELFGSKIQAAAAASAQTAMQQKGKATP